MTSASRRAICSTCSTRAASSASPSAPPISAGCAPSRAPAARPGWRGCNREVHPLIRHTGAGRCPWETWVPAFAGTTLFFPLRGAAMNSAREVMDPLIRQPGRGELLLELLSEEIPAGVQEFALGQLEAHLRQGLLAAEIPAIEPIRKYVTPRRLTIIATGIPGRQPARLEERRGPRAEAPQ